MTQHPRREALDVVGDHIVAPVERRRGARPAREQGRGARARPAFEVGAGARRADQADDIVDDLVGEADRRGGVDRGGDGVGVGDPLDPEIGDRRGAEAAAMLGDDAPFGVGVGIVDDQLEQEAVELRLGQRIDALLLDRVLRREDGEARAERVRLAAQRHAPFLHSLQQRRLRLGRGTVDLVGEQQLGEDRSLGQREARRLEVEQVRPQYVARHQVGGELDAPEIEPDRAREGLREQRLGGARRAFEQHVAAGEQRDRHHARQIGLADHRLGDLCLDRGPEGVDAVDGASCHGEDPS